MAVHGAQQRHQNVQDRRNNFFKLISNGMKAGGQIAGAGM
jgi:hypothetical protein